MALGYNVIATGEVAGSATAAQLPDIDGGLVNIKAQVSNVGNVYLGTSASVTVAAGTTDITSGWELDAGQETGWIQIPNLNLLWRICDNAGDDLTYIVLRQG